MKNAKDTQHTPRQNRCIIATPKQKNAASPLPNRQIFVPPPGHQATNRQNSNDFRTKKHSKNNDLDVVVNEVSELTQGLVTRSYTTAEHTVDSSDPYSVVVNKSPPYPSYYTAEPTKNALREAIVEQDIGPEGASWPPQISLRNGSNHGDLEWSKGGGVLQKCHRMYEKAKNL